MTTAISSDRLELVPLLPSFLHAVLEQDLKKAERLLGLSLPDDLLDSADVMALRLQQLQAEATFQPWSLRAIALRDRPVMVGHIGFHTPPGAAYLHASAPGGVEFGFTVYPPFRRLGYAREASQALMCWARQVHGVTRYVLSIRPDNLASQALAAGLGFVRVGSHLDEVDGLEDILTHELSP